MKHLYLLLNFILTLGITSCGNLNLGGTSASPNDPAPSGTAIAQAQFTSQNGATVSGAARIFATSNSGFVLRLEGISVPVETGLQVKVNSNTNAQLAAFALKSSTGSQNYNLSVAPGSQFSSVFIFSTQKNQNYGAALFQQTSTFQPSPSSLWE